MFSSESFSTSAFSALSFLLDAITPPDVDDNGGGGWGYPSPIIRKVAKVKRKDDDVVVLFIN